MNYLAHAYLSFGDPGWITGNLLSDFIKGKKKFSFPSQVQQGMTLHRAIDQFTDNHPAVKAAKEPFRASYRLYSGAFVDITFDHFLANDLTHFSDPSHLKNYTLQVYQALQQYHAVIPENLHNWFKRMAADDWLFNYQFNWAIGRSFGGLVYRSKYLTDSQPAFEIFESHYAFLRECFTQFFPDLYTFARSYANQNLEAKQ